MTLLDVTAVRADRGAAHNNAVHADVVLARVGHLEAAPTEAVPTEGVLNEAAPTDAVPADAAPTDTEAAPTKAVLGGRYCLGERLGGGSEAYVNEAYDLRTSTSVAVKIFRATEAMDNAPYRRELEIHGPLRHKNIVRVLGSGSTDDPGVTGTKQSAAAEPGRNFMVMERVGGEDLRSFLHRQSASPLQTAAWMIGIAQALAHLHKRRTVHNDIKPGNILVDFAADPDGPGIAKLTDFGIAINGRHAAPASSSGTPHYLSPEEVCGGASTAASDIYSLGLVALECLTGTKAFPGPPLESMVARTLREPRIPGTVRRRWSMVLHAMTDPNPAGRPSASQVVGMLRRLSW